MPFDASAARPVAATRAPAGSRQATAVAMVLAAAASTQFGGAFAITLFDSLGPGGAVLLRLAWAAAVLVALWRPAVRALTGSAWRTAAAFGVTLGLMNWSFYESVARIPLGVAVTLEFVGPLTVAVVGSRRRRDLVWVGLAAAGILLLGDFGGGELDRAGVGLAFLAGGFWAGYIVLSARTGAAISGGAGLAIAMTVAALVVLPAGVLQAGASLLSPELLAAGLVVALASSVIPYSLELEVLRRLPPAAFGVLMSLAPAVAALAGLVVLGQGLETTDVIAIALVVVASAGAALGGRPTAVPEP